MTSTVNSARRRPWRVLCGFLLVLVLLPASAAATPAGAPVTLDADANVAVVAPLDLNETVDDLNETVDATSTDVDASLEREGGNTTLSADGAVDGTANEPLDGSVAFTTTADTTPERPASGQGTAPTATAAPSPSTDGRADEGRRDGDLAGGAATATSTRATENGNGSASTGSGTDSSPSNPTGSPFGGAGAAVAGVAAAGVAAGSLTRHGPALALDGPATVETAKRSIAHGRRVASERLPRFVVPFGYSRHDDSDPLEHDVRATLYESVESKPGIHLSRLADRTAVSLSSVRHHLDVLADEGLVCSELIQGKRCYFRPGATDVTIAAALDDPATRSVLTTLASEGPSTGSELAATMDLDPSTVSHHLSRLEADGIVERERDGRRVITALTPATSRALGADDGTTSTVSSDGGRVE